jgi:hypothetical protein
MAGLSLRASSPRGNSRRRAAASSMARGRPSSRATTSAISGALSASRTKWGSTAAARSANRASASLPPGSAASSSGRGKGRGASGNSCSSDSRSGVRLVASTRIPGAASSSCAATTAAGRTCSKLSSTRSSRLDRRWSVSAWAAGRSGSSGTPRAVATADRTSSGSATSASETNQAPCGKASSREAATSTARRVLPDPGGPVTQTRRRACSSPWSSASSRRRPTKPVRWAGRWCGGRGGGVGSGTSRTGSWSRICSWRRRSQRLGSMPRSSSRTWRARWKAWRASAWRPERYSASMSWPHSRSR